MASKKTKDEKLGDKPSEKKIEKKEASKNTEKKEEKKPTTKKKAADKPVLGPLAREFGGQSATVLLAPILTEKSSNQESLGKYVFFVSPKATKVEVAAAVRDLYGVKPTSVRIVNVKGKKVRSGRIQGRKKDRKKAIVTLKKGDAISP